MLRRLLVFVLLLMPARADTWAVVVGVDRYQEPIPSLRFAGEDARYLAQALQLPPDHLNLLTSQSTDKNLQPTAPNVLRCLEDLARKARPQDTIIFYFAGHGVNLGGETCLLTEESDNLSAGSLLASSLRGSALLNKLQACKADKTLILIDACRNDPSGGTAANTLTSQLSRNLVLSPEPASGGERATATLFSCGLGERSYEWEEKKHGYFTYYLVEGWKGGAKQADGRVSLSSLVGYVRKEVKRCANGQSPMLRYEGPGPEEWTLAGTGKADPKLEQQALEQEKSRVDEDRARLEKERSQIEAEIAGLLKTNPSLAQSRSAVSGATLTQEQMQDNRQREKYAELLARKKACEAEASQLDWEIGRAEVRSLELTRQDPNEAAKVTANMQNAQAAMANLNRIEDVRVTADAAARAAQARADALAAENASILADRLRLEQDKARLEADRARLVAENARLAAQSGADPEVQKRADNAEAALAEAEARVKELEAEVARLEGDRRRLEASIQRLEAETAKIIAYRESGPGSPAAEKARQTEKAVQEAESRALAAEKARIEAEQKANEALAHAEALARKVGRAGSGKPGDARATRRGRVTDIIDWEVPEATEFPGGKP